MKTVFYFLVTSLMYFSTSVSANESMSKRSAFAEKYFAAWNITQKPNSTSEELEAYLELLTDDVAWQHLPYQPDDTRKPEGKQNLRKGMAQWLGVNTEYTAELTNTIIGQNIIVLKFNALVKFANTEGKIITRKRDYTDVLELDNGKVSLIRRYGK